MKTSRDPDCAAKKGRVEHLYAIADGEVIPEDSATEVVFCLDESGPLNLQPHPGRQWAERGGRHKDPEQAQAQAAGNLHPPPRAPAPLRRRRPRQGQALRSRRRRGGAAVDTDHPSHKEQGSVIRRYIIWRNRRTNDERLRAVTHRANDA
ncbi:hypothetical protein OG532_38255 [Streptomyces decoyicus]|nr:hypothetical protein OG532_38255 [Streptomyces decoyicus]